MSFFDQLLKGTKTTKKVVELELERKKLEKKLFDIVKNILFENEYRTVEKKEGLYICMQGERILDLTEKLVELEEQLAKEKSEYKNLFKKKTDDKEEEIVSEGKSKKKKKQNKKETDETGEE